MFKSRCATSSERLKKLERCRGPVQGTTIRLVFISKGQAHNSREANFENKLGFSKNWTFYG
jgi:hypothetical protein